MDPKRTGILGICSFGGFALNAAAMDARIQATVAVTMYDMTRVSAYGYFDALDEEGRYALKKMLNTQRTEDLNQTYAQSPDGLPAALTGQETQFVKDYWQYYKTERGFHPRSINSNGHWNKTSVLSLINLLILAYSQEIRTPGPACAR